MIQVLNSAKLELRKWMSNTGLLLQQINGEISSENIHPICSGETSKTLGIYWKPIENKLMYKIKQVQIVTAITKRNILSEVAQIFDPLELVSPCIL